MLQPIPQKSHFFVASIATLLGFLRSENKNATLFENPN